MKEIKTKYYGITIMQDEDGYYLQDANGGMSDNFDLCPTEQDVDEYRESVIPY